MIVIFVKQAWKSFSNYMILPINLFKPKNHSKTCRNSVRRSFKKPSKYLSKKLPKYLSKDLSKICQKIRKKSFKFVLKLCQKKNYENFVIRAQYPMLPYSLLCIIITITKVHDIISILGWNIIPDLKERKSYEFSHDFGKK